MYANYNIMEIFYTTNIDGSTAILNEEESKHCVRVLRHKEGDKIKVIDGAGTIYDCVVTQAKKSVVCSIESSVENFGTHSYSLTMAVAPTKNIDRYEWFLEKGTEMGMDVVVPVIGEHSERKIVKPERCERILLSATKQSLKAKLPQLESLTSVTEFIKSVEQMGEKVLKLIAYCGEATKKSLPEALEEYMKSIEKLSINEKLDSKISKLSSGESARVSNINANNLPKVVVLIGPEGDFSEKEVELAMAAGFTPIHLGASRLRTETAAVAAVSCLYFSF